MGKVWKVKGRVQKQAYNFDGLGDYIYIYIRNCEFDCQQRRKAPGEIKRVRTIPHTTSMNALRLRIKSTNW